MNQAMKAELRQIEKELREAEKLQEDIHTHPIDAQTKIAWMELYMARIADLQTRTLVLNTKIAALPFWKKLF